MIGGGDDGEDMHGECLPTKKKEIQDLNEDCGDIVFV